MDRDLGVPTIRRSSEPTSLVRWLQRKKAAAVVVRPDGFIYAAAKSGHLLPAPPAINADQNRSTRMTTAQLTEHTVTVNGKPIFVAETGTGPPVVLLHGGGPGASGVSNYSRNIDALAEHFRVIVPDMPGYGRSVKGVDQERSVRLPRRHDPRAARRTRHRHGASGRQLLRRRRCAAAGAGHARTASASWC